MQGGGNETHMDGAQAWQLERHLSNDPSAQRLHQPLCKGQLGRLGPERIPLQHPKLVLDDSSVDVILRHTSFCHAFQGLRLGFAGLGAFLQEGTHRGIKVSRYVSLDRLVLLLALHGSARH